MNRALRAGNASAETAGVALPIALGIALVGLVVVAFLPAFDAQFLNFDDDKLYTLSYRWRGLDTLRLRWMFGTAQMGHYQPLTWLSVALDHALYGLTPPAHPEAGGYHATSVGLHAAAALRCSRSPRACCAGRPQWNARTRLIAAAGAAAIWAVHPLRVESVVWLTERRDVLSAPFFFLALWAWLGWAAPGSAGARTMSIERAALALSAPPASPGGARSISSTPTQVTIGAPSSSHSAPSPGSRRWGCSHAAAGAACGSP